MTTPAEAVDRVRRLLERDSHVPGAAYFPLLLERIDELEGARAEAESRAEAFEGALKIARATNQRLNRRAQYAESGVADTLEKAARSNGSIGRSLARAGYVLMKRQRDQAIGALEFAIVLADRLVTNAFTSPPHCDGLMPWSEGLETVVRAWRAHRERLAVDDDGNLVELNGKGLLPNPSRCRHGYAWMCRYCGDITEIGSGDTAIGNDAVSGKPGCDVPGADDSDATRAT